VEGRYLGWQKIFRMTIKEIRPTSVEDGIKTLESAAFLGPLVIFRGHADPSWRLTSTLSRFMPTHLADMHLIKLDDMLHEFIANMRSVGDLPEAATTRRGRLEYGRHYGVPSPLIDFTYSPYVALFFAYNDIGYRHEQADQTVVIHVLDLSQLASAEHRRFIPSNIPKYNWFFDQNDKIYDEMLDERYPMNVLKFFQHPASWNIRMQRQIGCFLYDTIRHKLLGFRDLEEFIEKADEVDSLEAPGRSCLTKVFFKKFWIGAILARLELMGITGTHLLGQEGAAMDVRNSYLYGRKTGRPWDLRLPGGGTP
jgi:hypothetical protein